VVTGPAKDSSTTTARVANANGSGVQWGLYVANEKVEAIGGEWISVENPAVRGTVIAQVPRAREADVDRAVAAAAQAFTSWRRVSPADRCTALHAVADLLAEHREEMAHLVALETGNAIRTQARPDVDNAVETLRYFAGLTREIKGQTIPLDEETLSYTRREPYGVVGAIIPWNSLTGGVMKIAMAISSSNTVVLKASEEAPLAILRTAEYFGEVLPPGVVNVLSGYGSEAGAALSAHPGVAKLTFTGSTAVGSLVMSSGAQHIVPSSLELGGKSPAIVYPDANSDATVAGVISGMRFTRVGQSCTAGSRLLLHESIAEVFVDALSTKLSKLHIGDPLDEETDIGSLISETQYRKVTDYIEQGLSQKGAILACGGDPRGRPELAGGYFVEPTVFTGINNDWRIAQEEIFGPVLCVSTWSDEADAIRLANATHYGLAAFVWCRDIAVALRTAHQIDAGGVQINSGGGPRLGQSFGGVKASGMGREFSLEGLLEGYTRTKAVMVHIGDETD
jgi:acyl-CoA reductase-like NAD-dependent aldehyde dehydrogenase